MTINLTAAKTAIRGFRHMSPEFKKGILATLPKVGKEYSCPYCKTVTHIPRNYTGMWVVCNTCGGVQELCSFSLNNTTLIWYKYVGKNY